MSKVRPAIHSLRLGPNGEIMRENCVSKGHQLDKDGASMAFAHDPATADDIFTGHTRSQEHAYQRWCREHECTHAHCQAGCEHPQPFLSSDGRMLCGRCWFVYNHTETIVLPCGKDNCK